MIRQVTLELSSLYEQDETAWLEAMADLVRQERLDELDYPHLSEYLSHMARRDRREVKSRLRVLLAHLLKWIHQPDSRTGSWRATIVGQREDLKDLLDSGVLRNHADEVLETAFESAVEQAEADTQLPRTVFPGQCPYTIDQLLSANLLDEADGA